MIASLQESYDKPRQGIEKQRHHFANKGLYSEGYGISSTYSWIAPIWRSAEWLPSLGGNKTQMIMAALESCRQVHFMALDTKVECQRIVAFELLCWRRLLRVLDCK